MVFSGYILTHCCLNHILSLILDCFGQPPINLRPYSSDLKEAKEFLSEASRLDIDDAKLDLIHEKMDAVDKKIASLNKWGQNGVKSTIDPCKIKSLYVIACHVRLE
jgi:uncharacterized protein YdcH (DUF465 family)